MKKETYKLENLEACPNGLLGKGGSLLFKTSLCIADIFIIIFLILFLNEQIIYIRHAK